MKNSHLLMVAFVIGMLGCAKDDGNVVPTTPTTPTTVECKPLVFDSEYANGDPLLRQEYTYNTLGFEIGYKLFSHGQFGHEYKNYQHDQFGNVTYFEVFDDSGILTDKWTVTFLAYKKPLTRIMEDVVSGETERQEFTYNANGFLIGEKYFRNGIFASERKNFQHDQHGNATYYETFNSNGDWITKVTSTFLAPDKWLTIKNEYSNGSVQKQEQTFNAQGFLIGWKVFLEGNLYNDSKNYQHDQYGNATYFESFSPTGQLTGKTTTTYACF